MIVLITSNRICLEYAVLWLPGELDAVVGQNRVDAIRNDLEQMFEKLPGGLAICFIHELHDRKWTGPIDT